MRIANVEMAAAWDGEEGAHWADHAERYESTSDRFRAGLLSVAGLTPASVVLDIGCGTGRSARDAARIATDGSVLGVDLSARMLERARSLASEEGLDNVRFEQGDVQVHSFEGEHFDSAISMFGSMFFVDPVAAFSNVERALRAGGQIALLAWRELGENQWVHAIRHALAAGRTLPEPPPDAPGPFAFARREHVADVLRRAGFEDVSFEEITAPVRFGRDADDAFAFVSTFGITRGLIQGLDGAAASAALEALHRVLAEHESSEGVQLAGSAWLITARAGGARR